MTPTVQVTPTTTPTMMYIMVVFGSSRRDSIVGLSMATAICKTRDDQVLDSCVPGLDEKRARGEAKFPQSPGAPYIMSYARTNREFIKKRVANSYRGGTSASVAHFVKRATFKFTDPVTPWSWCNACHSQPGRRLFRSTDRLLGALPWVGACLHSPRKEWNGFIMSKSYVASSRARLAGTPPVLK